MKDYVIFKYIHPTKMLAVHSLISTQILYVQIGTVKIEAINNH